MKLNETQQLRKLANIFEDHEPSQDEMDTLATLKGVRREPFRSLIDDWGGEDDPLVSLFRMAGLKDDDLVVLTYQNEYDLTPDIVKHIHWLICLVDEDSSDSRVVLAKHGVPISAFYMSSRGFWVAYGCIGNKGYSANTNQPKWEQEGGPGEFLEYAMARVENWNFDDDYED